MTEEKESRKTVDGSIIGNYRILNELEVDVFSNSYLVEVGTEQYVMRKWTEPRVTDPVFYRFFENQCVMRERLKPMGSSIQQVEDHFVEGDHYYQVMRPLPGISLEDFLVQDGDYAHRLSLGVSLCGLVAQGHGHSIVFQDLSPGQVWMANDEEGRNTALGYRPILKDFAWAFPDARCVKIVGTPYYHSPEHHRGETPTTESDIFTVGIMLYEFLTGRNPYDFGEIATEDDFRDRVLNRKINGEPQEWNPDIPAGITAAILGCLDPDPEKRPALLEIRKALIRMS